jgi:hypothetical protein
MIIGKTVADLFVKGFNSQYLMVKLNGSLWIQKLKPHTKAVN